MRIYRSHRIKGSFDAQKNPLSFEAFFIDGLYNFSSLSTYSSILCVYFIASFVCVFDTRKQFLEFNSNLTVQLGTHSLTDAC